MNSVTFTCYKCKGNYPIDICQSCAVFGIDPLCKRHGPASRNLPMTYNCPTCAVPLVTLRVNANLEVEMVLHHKLL